MYNYIFYKGYQLGILTKSFADIPILGGIASVSFCLALHIGTVVIVMDRIGVISSGYLPSFNKLYFAVIIVGFVAFFYYFKGMGRKIIQKYDGEKQNKIIYRIHPALVISFAYLLSTALLITVIFI